MPFVRNPQISPDGARIVYVTSKGLMLHELNEFDSRILPGTEGAYEPFFSPDGQWVGFYADEKMKKVSVAGGHPQRHLPFWSMATSRGGLGSGWFYRFLTFLDGGLVASVGDGW